MHRSQPLLFTLLLLGSLTLAAPGTPRATSETVDIGHSGLGVPGSDPEPPPAGPLDGLRVEPRESEHVEIPLAPAETAPPPESADAPTDEDVSGAETSGDSLALLDHLGAEAELHGPVLTLDEAMERALSRSPQLVALALEVDAELAGVLTARLKPVPELDISLSEFLGMNERRQLRSSVSEVTYSRTVERLEKRLARMRAARLDGDVARWDYEAAVRDIQQTVARAYVDVLVAQERQRIQALLLNLAEGLRGAVALRFEAGTVSELELSRLDIEVSSARISAAQADSALDAARRRLSALWGELEPDFTAVAGRLSDTPPVPAIATLLPLLPEHPYLARYAADAAARQARLDLALAESALDYTIRGGVQGFADSGEMALTLGITIPTKPFGRNPGAVRAAELRLEQLEAQSAATRRELEAQLVDALGRLRLAAERAEALGESVIPAAVDNVDRTTVGYRYGKFSYLDVLESERTLVDAASSYVDALADYQAARVDVERLIGRPLHSLAQPELDEQASAAESADPSDESAMTEALEEAPDSEILTILEEGNG